MASVVNWQQQSVDSFLEQVNWLGLAAAIPTPVETQDWLALSVRDFLQDCNWDGKRVVRQLAWGASPIVADVGERTWLNWSVAEFIQATNWSGQRLSPLTATPEVPAEALALSNRLVLNSWQQLSLTDFFERVNWLGKPEQVQLLPGMQSPLQLSVAQFLSTVAWELKPMIAAVPLPPPPPEPEPEPTMTLTDLSSLF